VGEHALDVRGGAEDGEPVLLRLSLELLTLEDLAESIDLPCIELPILTMCPF
jgi:hypothetical protein